MRQLFKLIAKTLRRFAHDAVGEAGVARKSACEQVPGFGSDQKNDRAYDRDGRSSANGLYIHRPSVSGSRWAHCDAGHSDTTKGDSSRQFSALIQVRRCICECHHDINRRRVASVGGITPISDEFIERGASWVSGLQEYQ